MSSPPIYKRTSFFSGYGSCPSEETGRVVRSKSLGAGRVIFSEAESRPISTKRTVASLIFGEESLTEAALFNRGVRDHAGALALWTAWCVGTLIGLLVVGRILPMKFVWASALMLPLPLVTISLLSVDLLKEIYATMDVHVITILQVAMFVDGLYYTKFDSRRVFWFCYLPSMITSGVVDAYPAKYRAFFAKYWFSAAIIVLIIWNVLVAFQWDAFGKSISMKSATFFVHHISDQLSLSVFFLRHLWCSIFVPEGFVMIKAEMFTGRIMADEESAEPIARSVSEVADEESAEPIARSVSEGKT